MTTFTCAKCSVVFNKGWSDEEMWEEYGEAMPEVPPDEPTALVCDDCYQRFMASPSGPRGEAWLFRLNKSQ